MFAFGSLFNESYTLTILSLFHYIQSNFTLFDLTMTEHVVLHSKLIHL